MRRLVGCPARLAHTLMQKFKEERFRHRRRYQHALAEVATHRNQSLQVSGILHARRYCNATEAVRQIDRGLADGGIGGVSGTAGHE